MSGTNSFNALYQTAHTAAIKSGIPFHSTDQRERWIAEYIEKLEKEHQDAIRKVKYGSNPS
jgi:hypothetical protein